MTEDWKPKSPDYKGDGVSIWKGTTKDGKTYLKVKIMGSISVACFKYEPKPKEKKEESDI